jgi:hypothetical protein
VGSGDIRQASLIAFNKENRFLFELLFFLGGLVCLPQTHPQASHEVQALSTDITVIHREIKYLILLMKILPFPILSATRMIHVKHMRLIHALTTVDSQGSYPQTRETAFSQCTLVHTTPQQLRQGCNATLRVPWG